MDAGSAGFAGAKSSTTYMDAGSAGFAGAKSSTFIASGVLPSRDIRYVLYVKKPGVSPAQSYERSGEGGFRSIPCLTALAVKT